jgi:hypothetical protein
MHNRARRALARSACVGLVMLLVGGLSSLVSVRSTDAASPPQVIVRHVATLDVHGRAAHVFTPGSRIQLRIQWSVRGTAPRDRQTVTWSVMYGGTEVMHTVKTITARAGNWSEVTVVSVNSKPNMGTHTFVGRVAVGKVVGARSVTFTIHS